MTEENVYEIIAITNCKLTGHRCGAGKTLEYIDIEIDELIPHCEICREYINWKKSSLSISKYHEREALRRLDEEEFNEEHR